MTWSPQSDGTSEPGQRPGDSSPSSGAPTSGSSGPASYPPPPAWPAPGADLTPQAPPPAYPATDPYASAYQPPTDPYAQAGGYQAGQYPVPQQQYQAYPGGQPGYAAPYPQYGAPVRTTNVMAILSLVFAFVFSPAGIVLGHIAKKQIAQTGEEGGGLATAGLVLSYIFTGFSLLACCGLILLPIIASGAGN